MVKIRILIIVFIVLLTVSCSSEEVIFDECDINQDGITSKIEVKKCLTNIPEESIVKEDNELMDEVQNDEKIEEEAEYLNSEEIEVNIDYVMFVLNVHDWVFPDKSADAILKTIELHEGYDIPIDIYLTGTTLHNYVNDYPDLVEKMINSDVVSISYHFRPPMPMYSGFDNVGLSGMDNQELYNTLISYSENKLDLETGEYIAGETGGYQFVKDIIGYPPLAVGHTSGNSNIAKTLAEIYVDKGAKFTVTHGKELNLGDENKGLYLRPENVEIKWYEQNSKYMMGKIDAEQLINERLEGYEPQTGLFINIKMHENNYYTTGTPFGPVYWVDGDKNNPLGPPYDLSLGEEQTGFRTDEYTENMWEFYESALIYVNENPEKFSSISVEDVLEMI